MSYTSPISRTDEMPQYIIIPTGERFRDLRAAVRCPSLPTIDFDAVLSAVIHAISHRQTFPMELEQLREDMVHGELLTGRVSSVREGSSFDMGIEDPSEDILSLEAIASLSVKLGHEISNSFENLKLYSDGFLGYEYRETLHDQSLVCRRR